MKVHKSIPFRAQAHSPFLYMCICGNVQLLTALQSKDVLLNHLAMEKNLLLELLSSSY